MQRLLRRPPRAATFAFATLALAGLAGSATAGGPADVPAAAAVAASRLEIEVTWDDPTHALPFPSSWVAEELAAQLRPLGILVHFSAARGLTVTPAETLRVILLERHPLERTQHSNVIGLAQRQPSARAVWLLLSSTRRALGLDANPDRLPPLHQRRLLARALARVASHELVHAFVPAHPHAGEGLMQARLDRDALTRLGVGFDAGTARVLVSALSVDGVPGVRLVAGSVPPAALRQPTLAPPGTVLPGTLY